MHAHCKGLVTFPPPPSWPQVVVATNIAETSCPPFIFFVTPSHGDRWRCGCPCPLLAATVSSPLPLWLQVVVPTNIAETS